ncbi:MAG: hypothetical protein PVI68_19650, partial [Anaerolineae bacterium]
DRIAAGQADTGQPGLESRPPGSGSALLDLDIVRFCQGCHGILLLANAGAQAARQVLEFAQENTQGQ